MSVFERGESRQDTIESHSVQYVLDAQGLLRIKSTVTNASLSDAVKTPILLHTNYIYSDMVIKESRAIILHSGIRDT